MSNIQIVRVIFFVIMMMVAMIAAQGNLEIKNQGTVFLSVFFGLAALILFLRNI